jgi:hypothetical protein
MHKTVNKCGTRCKSTNHDTPYTTHIGHKIHYIQLNKHDLGVKVLILMAQPTFIFCSSMGSMNGSKYTWVNNGKHRTYIYTA